MKAILINAVLRTVTQVDIVNGVDSIRQQLGVSCFTAVNPFEDSSDAVYCDDEGLMKNPQDFFTLGNYPEPIAGNGLIIGTDSEGRSVNCESLLEDIKNDVIFMDLGALLSKCT